MSVAQPTNAMSIDTDRLKRDVALHRCGQVLADATYVRTNGSPRGLSTMPAEERDWFKSTARQLIELFESMTAGKAPDAEIRDAEAQTRQRLDRELASIRQRIDIARQRARVAAAERGHDLGSWHAKSDLDGHEVAYCRRCRRSAEIELDTDPEMAGPALSEGCLSEAVEPSRPDAFLANQHKSDLEGGR